MVRNGMNRTEDMDGGFEVAISAGDEDEIGQTS